MKTISPYKLVLFVSFLIAVIIGVLADYSLLGEQPNFTWICLLFFTFITLFTLYLAELSSKSSTASKSVFTVLGAMTLKFVFSILLIIGYYLAVKPAKATFIIPFFVLYAVFAVIETYLLQVKKTN